MALEYERPHPDLMRELQDVARDADLLIVHLREDNTLPESFPTGELRDFCTTLSGLQQGTAEGCRAPLEHARARLPAIRREFLIGEDHAPPVTNPDAAPPPMRGMALDQLLRNLYASVGTALDQYRQLAGAVLDDTVTGEPTATARDEPTVKQAAGDARRLEQILHDGARQVDDMAEPGSANIDRLTRRMRDAEGLARSAGAELRMRTIVIRWFRNIAASLRNYPDLIRRAGAAVQVGADIARPLAHVWHEFEKRGMDLVLQTTTDVGNALVEVGNHLERRRTGTGNGGTGPRDPAIPEKPDWADSIALDQFGTFVTIAIPTRRGPPVVQRLRLIPPGSFLMGSPEDEPGRTDNEGPQQRITFAAGFWLADTPCTQALWRAVTGRNPSRFKSGTRPVEQVSFDDVSRFLTGLNALRPGLALRLPSEAEWEYACRAGTGTATYAGKLEILGTNNAPVLDPIAWYGGNSGVDFELKNGVDSSDWPEKQYDHRRAGTHPVSLKRANAWGLHDMLGNVWEWCADAWHGTLRGIPVDGAARMGDSNAAPRVVRGGAWFDDPRDLRSANRNRNSPDLRSGDLGFRVARTL